jgi:dTDP-4-dehydrorhamnose 3,5-epimerase
VIFTETKIKGAFIIGLDRREDHRGFFARSWCEREFKDHGLDAALAQINVGFSHKRGTLRGLHFQLPPYEEVKVTRCTMGAMYDVVVDLRPDSPTYKQWVGVELTADNRLMLYVPKGCVRGYVTLADHTEMYYLASQSYVPDHARGVRYDDPAFGIDWPVAVEVISDADVSWPDYKG